MLYSVFVLLVSALVFQMLYVLIPVLIAYEKKFSHVSLLNNGLIADCSLSVSHNIFKVLTVRYYIGSFIFCV